MNTADAIARLVEVLVILSGAGWLLNETCEQAVRDLRQTGHELAARMDDLAMNGHLDPRSSAFIELREDVVGAPFRISSLQMLVAFIHLTTLKINHPPPDGPPLLQSLHQEWVAARHHYAWRMAPAFTACHWTFQLVKGLLPREDEDITQMIPTRIRTA